MPIIERTISGVSYLTKSTVHTYIPATSTGDVRVTVYEDENSLDYQGKEFARLRIVTNKFPVMGGDISGVEVSYAATADVTGKTGTSLDLAYKDRVSQNVSFRYSDVASGQTSAITFINVAIPYKPYSMNFRLRFHADGKEILDSSGNVYEVATSMTINGSSKDPPAGSFCFDSEPVPGSGTTANKTRSEARYDGIYTQWVWISSGNSESPVMIDIWRAFNTLPTTSGGWEFVGTAPFTKVEDWKGFGVKDGISKAQYIDGAPQDTGGTFYYMANPVHRDGWKRDIVKAVVDFVPTQTVSASIKILGTGGNTIIFSSTHYLDGNLTVKDALGILDSVIFDISGITAATGFSWDRWHEETFTGSTSGTTAFTVSYNMLSTPVWVILSGVHLVKGQDYVLSAPRTVYLQSSVAAYLNQVLTIQYLDTG